MGEQVWPFFCGRRGGRRGRQNSVAGEATGFTPPDRQGNKARRAAPHSPGRRRSSNSYAGQVCEGAENSVERGKQGGDHQGAVQPKCIKTQDIITQQVYRPVDAVQEGPWRWQHNRFGDAFGTTGRDTGNKVHEGGRLSLPLSPCCFPLPVITLPFPPCSPLSTSMYVSRVCAVEGVKQGAPNPGGEMHTTLQTIPRTKPEARSVPVTGDHAISPLDCCALQRPPRPLPMHR